MRSQHCPPVHSLYILTIISSTMLCVLCEIPNNVYTVYDRCDKLNTV